MAIRRRTRIILIVLAVPVFLLLILVLFLKLYFTSNRLKAILVPELQAALNREVNINEISLSFLPSFGVKIEGLDIANRKGPGFSEQPLAHLDEFLIDVKLLPLLGSRLEVNRLSFSRPKIVLEVNKNGEENFASPQAGEKTTGEDGLRVRTSDGGSLLLSNFEINDGELDYIDEKENRATRLKDIDVRLRVESIVQVNELRTESEVTIGSFSYGSIEKPLVSNMPLSVKQKSRIFFQENNIIVEQGDLEIQGMHFRMGGNVTVVHEKPSAIDLTFDSDNLNLKQILSLLPPNLLKETEIAEIDGNARLSARMRGDLGEGKQPEISVDGSLTDGKIQYTKLPKAITDINFKARLASAKSTSKLEVTDFSARLGENPVKMKMILDSLSDPVVDANITGIVNLSQVKYFYPVEAGKELSGLVRAEVSLRGKTSVPTSIKGQGTLELQNVTVSAAEKSIRNLNGVLSFNNRILEAKQLKMQYGESDLSLAFALRDYLSLLFPAISVSGKAQAARPSMSVSLSSSNFESSPSKEPIALPPFDVDASVEISKFVYKGKTPFECTNLRGNVSSSENGIRLKNLSFGTLDGMMSATGAIDLRNKERPLFDLNIDVNGVDGHSFLKRFTSFGEHLFGKFSLTVALKGELNDTLGFNTKSLSGDGSVHVVDGKLTGYLVMQRLATFLELPELREPSFKTWSNVFKISEGKINLPDLKIAASGNDFLLTGWHGFDGSFDYSMTIRLSEELSNRFSGKSVAQQIGSLFKDKDGRVMLFLLVGGTTEDPKFRWDTRVAQETLRQKVDAEVEKKREEIRDKTKEELQKKIDEGKEKLKERLKKLFKKP